jgi:hypothetical protein
MNCPNCGSEIFANQQYCRLCGADLVEDRPSVFRPQIGALLVLLLIFGGLLTAMAGKLWSVKWVTFTGVFIMIGGMFLVAAYGLLRQSRPRSRKRKPLPPSEPLLRADTTNKLLPIGDNDFIPSVVDPTTELLTTPAPARSISKE